MILPPRIGGATNGRSCPPRPAIPVPAVRRRRRAVRLDEAGSTPASAPLIIRTLDHGNQMFARAYPADHPPVIGHLRGTLRSSVDSQCSRSHAIERLADDSSPATTAASHLFVAPRNAATARSREPLSYGLNTVCAEGIRTPNLLIRSQIWAVHGRPLGRTVVAPICGLMVPDTTDRRALLSRLLSWAGGGRHENCRRVTTSASGEDGPNARELHCVGDA